MKRPTKHLTVSTKGISSPTVAYIDGSKTTDRVEWASFRDELIDEGWEIISCAGDGKPFLTYLFVRKESFWTRLKKLTQK